MLTEPGSTTTLDQALAHAARRCRRLLVDDAYAEPHADADLDLAVGAGPARLHLLHLRLHRASPRARCASTPGCSTTCRPRSPTWASARARRSPRPPRSASTSRCGSSSRALLVGGPTLLVEQDVILDVDAVRRHARRRPGRGAPGRALVPRGRADLPGAAPPRAARPALRVARPGEALKQELAQRWFADPAGIKLVNAYGLTETSDDTNHEVMHARPRTGDRSRSAGRCRTCAVYVVDEHLSPVPLGAPGLIVFSGVCVGRGYVNDPERTAADCSWPTRTAPGERLYRAGDYGRWRPDGKLEFLGRRDNQVKISGLPHRDRRDRERPAAGARRARRRRRRRRAGRRDEAPGRVLRRPGAARRRRCSASPRRVAARLHGPVAFHWRDSLPLTPTARSTEAADRARRRARRRREVYDAPSTPTEQRLASAWATVLGIPVDQIGRRDHFFDQGGTSLSAVKLAIALKRAVSLKDITRNPVLADLAALVDGKSRATFRAAAIAVGGTGTPNGRAGVLPARGWERRELPAPGRCAARQRAGGARRRAARSRPRRRPPAVRAHGASGRAGRGRDRGRAA